MSDPPDSYEMVPSAARLAPTLRDVGYDFKAAVADLIDNSIAAKATRIDIAGRFSGGDSWIRITDNGNGMTHNVLNEALRYGSHRERYEPDELGKFGLGLKTASHSQCRQLTVATKQDNNKPIEARIHDIDHFTETDRWEIKVLPPSEQSPLLSQPLEQYKSGTVVLWKKLDRMLDYKDPSGRWAEAGLRQRLEGLDQYLGMIFHRFISKEVYGRPELKIYVRKTQVEPWDPFCRTEPHTEKLISKTFKIPIRGRYGEAHFTPYVLPNSHMFSSREAYNRAGRNRWTASQGLWIYRADRLIQDGGWSNLVTNDEHTKYARAALEFFPNVDDAFGINIAKMRVTLPTSLRADLQGSVATLRRRANTLYRAGKKPKPSPGKTTPDKRPTRRPTPPPYTTTGIQEDAVTSLEATRIGKSLEQAAMNVGEEDPLEKIKRELHRIDERSSNALGW